MLSFVEHVVAVTEKMVHRSERRNRDRSGGPGDEKQEIMRHRRRVHGLRKIFNTKDRKGFKSPEEERRERAAYKLRRSGERDRFHRKVSGKYTRQ